MVNLLDWYRQGLGNAVEKAGSFFGVPETGVSEWVAGGPTANTQRQAYAAESNDTGGGFIGPVYNGPQTTGGTPTGTTTTGQIAPNTSTLEGAQTSSLDAIDQAINAGMQALQQYEGTLQPQANQMIGEAETSANQQTRDTTAEKASRLGDLGGQRVSAEKKTGSAISEARRMAAEIQQGIQSRFGGSTGTGGFVSEIMGRSATQNISGNRMALQETLGKIMQSEEQVKTAAENMLTTIQENLTTAKDKAQSWLRTAMAEVNSQKAALQGDKAKMRMEVIGQYQTAISNLNETFRQEQNAVITKAQQASTKLSEWQKSILPKYDPNTQKWGWNGTQMGDTGSSMYGYQDSSGKFGTKVVSSANPDEENPFNQ